MATFRKEQAQFRKVLPLHDLMAITARDHLRNFPALYTSLSTAFTLLLKTSSHRALQIP